MASIDYVPNHYIVTFKDHITHDSAYEHIIRVQNDLSQTPGAASHAGVIHRYDILGFAGYSGSFDDHTLSAIWNSTEIASVEPDIYANTQVGNFHIEQKAPSWGLSRICRSKRVDEKATSYVYPPSNGQNTYAYVIDTGVYIDHNEFNNNGLRRARWGTTIVSSQNSTKNTDTNGHGTHVAGTIAGFACGVAKQAMIISVKVCADVASNERAKARVSDVIKALEWSVKDAGPDIYRSVVNMSLGAPKHKALNLAVQAVVSAGMTVVVAAGNDAMDASERSPASAPEAIAVGATKKNDKTRKTSNYGKFVDILAPGHKIRSAGIENKSKFVKMSGTSMASPHVAGVVCCLLSSTTKGQPPVAIIQLLKKMAGRDEITLKKQKDTLNLMLNNGVHV